MNTFRKISSLLLTLTLTTGMWALDTDYRLSFRAGAIMNDGKVEKVSPLRSATLGGEFAVTFHPDWQALSEWNNAGIGAALSIYDLGDTRKLGQAIAPYAFLEVPLLNRPHFILGLRLGVGVGFLTKTYLNTIPELYRYRQLTYIENGTTQYANQCIGSVTNYYFPEALYMEVPIRNGWTLSAGAGWYHFSNGSTVQPNSGYNIFAGEIGAKKSAWPATPPSAQPRTQVDKNWEIEASWVGSGRQVYYRDQMSFFACAFQVAGYWRAHPIFRLGGGVDVFYDGAYIPRETKYGKTNLTAARDNGADCWRIGLSVQPEMVVGKFTFGVHVGAYILDPVKELELDKDYATTQQLLQYASLQRVTGKGIFYPYDLLKAGSAGYPDGWLYEQVVLRYHLPYHITIQASMKAHITKVEFIGLGLGVSF